MSILPMNTAGRETPEKLEYAIEDDVKSKSDTSIPSPDAASSRKPTLPISWRLGMIILTCFCSFGNHWSNGLIVALKTTIIHSTHINNSKFATLVAVTNLVNTVFCIFLGFAIDKWGGASLSVVLAFFHLAGSMVMAGAATSRPNSFPLLIAGKVIAAVGDGSLDNAQHRVFSTYFAPGRGFAFSIGMVWSISNLGQFVGMSTANVITHNLGSYAWSLWISAAVSCFSFLCALGLVYLDRFLRSHYHITDQTDGTHHQGVVQRHVFSLTAVRRLSTTFWVIVAFAVFENAGVQSFVSISTQFAQQRLKKGAVVGGWVSSFYLLLPVGLTPFLGVWIDVFGHRVSFLFLSSLTFLTSMLFLKFSQSLPTFVTAYVFYALAQCFTPAPQVEIIRNVIPDPRYFATAFAIKKSVVQASIVIITTAAGKIQDNSHGTLDNAVSLWLSYALISTCISGSLLLVSTPWWTLLPAARLAQVTPSQLSREICRLDGLGDDEHEDEEEEEEDDTAPTAITGPRARSDKEPNGALEGMDAMMERVGPRARGRGVPTLAEREYDLKVLAPGRAVLGVGMLVVSVGIIVLGWVMFGLGVGWGVHGSVVAGTVGE